MNLLRLCELLETSNMYDRAYWALMDAQGRTVEVYWRIEDGTSKWKVIKGEQTKEYGPLVTLPAKLEEFGISPKQLATEVHKKVLSLAVSANMLINKIKREVGDAAVCAEIEEHRAFEGRLLGAIRNALQGTPAETVSKPRLSIIRNEK